MPGIEIADLLARDYLSALGDHCYNRLIGGAQTTGMLDRYHAAVNERARENNHPAARRVNPDADRAAQVNPSMAGSVAVRGRGEGGQHDWLRSDGPAKEVRARGVSARCAGVAQQRTQSYDHNDQLGSGSGLHGSRQAQAGEGRHRGAQFWG